MVRYAHNCHKLYHFTLIIKYCYQWSYLIVCFCIFLHMLFGVHLFVFVERCLCVCVYAMNERSRASGLRLCVSFVTNWVAHIAIITIIALYGPNQFSINTTALHVVWYYTYHRWFLNDFKQRFSISIDCRTLRTTVQLLLVLLGIRR